jgi:hypothetical protein
MNRRELGVVGLLSLSTALVTTYVGMAGFRADDGGTLDNQRYTGLALGHSDVVPKPFHYRIVVPAVVRLLPSLSHDPTRAAQLGLAAIDVGALTVAGIALYLLLRTWGAAQMLALVGVLSYFLSHAVLRFATIPLIESSAWAILILAMLAAERRRYLALAVIVLLGMFVKETTVIALAYPWVMSAPLSQRIRLSACAVPGVVAYAVYRMLEPVPGYTYSAGQVVHSLSSLLSADGLGRWRTIVLAFGPWWLLLAVALRRREGLVPNRYAWQIVGCFAIAAALRTDYERVLFLTFPVVLGLSLPTLARWLSTTSRPPEPVASGPPVSTR